MIKPQTNLTNLAMRFLEHKKKLGVKYETGEYYLANFLRYVNTHSPGAQLPNKELVVAWCDTAADTPACLYNMASVVREFGKYLVMAGFTDAYVLPPKCSPRLTPHLPHFFTPDEINAFFRLCDRITARRECPGRELVIPMIFRLLYCCGLRCREARILLCCDMHLDSRYFDIKESKGRSRRIFVSGSLAEMLQRYDERMNVIIPGRTYFFPKSKRESYVSSFVSKNFSRIWNEAVPAFSSPIKPRAYDFRHHFAYTNLNRWAEQGEDVNVMLAYLMRYMGHANIQSTLYYFHSCRSITVFSRKRRERLKL
jgi:integrase